MGDHGVLIIGAGLTGLSAALRLKELGFPFRLFERDARAGGYAVTVEDSGYRFDRTGHLLHLRDPEIRALVLELVGDDYEVVQRRALVWSNGVYTRYPFQANTFGLPPEVAYECLIGFIRACYTATPAPPQNFEEFCLRHFGEGISKHFMVPYNARLWGVHPREIGTEWCQRFVPLPRLEDVVAGAVGWSDRELGYNASFIYPRRGIGVLADALAARVGAIELRRAPERIDWRQRRVRIDGEVARYKTLINTAPLPALVGMLEDPPGEIVTAARRLRHTHLYYLDVALDAECRTDVHWVYVPEERYPFYRVGCYSNFSRSMAPPGKAGLYVELAERAEPDVAELLPLVSEGLLELGFIADPAEIAFARLRRMAHAYVIYDRAHASSVAEIHGFLRENGILSTGRYGEWNYSSMEDALLMGRTAAEAAARANSES